MIPGLYLPMPSFGTVARTLGSKITWTASSEFGSFATRLANAFDGATDQNGATSASQTATFAYCGAAFSSSRIYEVKCYGATDMDFVNSYAGSVTLDIYANATGSNPANSTDGTLIGTSTFTDTTTQSIITIESTDKETLWTRAWVRITADGSSRPLRMCEFEVYQAV